MILQGIYVLSMYNAHTFHAFVSFSLCEFEEATFHYQIYVSGSRSNAETFIIL